MAAWFKLTNRVIPGCGMDLFSQPYATVTRCIAGNNNKLTRAEPLSIAQQCLADPSKKPVYNNPVATLPKPNQVCIKQEVQ